MDDTTEALQQLFATAGAVLPPDEYAIALAQTARGANEMRPAIIERVAAIARSGEGYDGSNRYSALLRDVTTIALIDRACHKPPVRLIYSRAYTPSEEDGA